jgi:hypothetical protein
MDIAHSERPEQVEIHQARMDIHPTTKALTRLYFSGARMYTKWYWP